MRNYLLLTPGPLSTSQTVREAMLQDWCTWDKDYNEGVVEVIRRSLLEIANLNPEQYTSILLQGSGTYCVEATLGCMVRPKDQLLVFSNGAYGERMIRIAECLDLNCQVVMLPETEPVTGLIVGEALDRHPDTTHVAVVHCETTTGILNPIEEIAPAVKSRGLTLMVDAMSSFAGIPIDIAGLGIDFLVSSSNKCLQGVPGVGLVLARREALERCKGVARSLSLDLYDQWAEMEKGHGKWRFTSPTHVVRAMMQAILELQKEGEIEARNARYRHNHATLVEGMSALGYRTLLSAELQSPIITSFLYPNEEFDFVDFYEFLKARGFVIYPGKISDADTFRIGNIGDVFPEDFQGLVHEVGNYKH